MAVKGSLPTPLVFLSLAKGLTKKIKIGDSDDVLALSPKVYGNYCAISKGKLTNQELAGSLGKLNESVQNAYLKWTFRCRVKFVESMRESRMSHATDRLLGAEKFGCYAKGTEG